MGMLIRLQHIYNFLLFHAVILSFLVVLQSFYSNFISFFGTNLLTWCQVPVAIFRLFSTTHEINIKWSPNAAKLFVVFLDQKISSGPRKHLRGAPRGAQPTGARREAQARPGGLCPPQWPPAPLLCSMNTPIFQKPYASRRKSIPTAASSRTTRSNLDTISEGFIMSIGASLMMRE